MSSDTQLPANYQLSHYRIVKKLGAGGMGEVYLAQDETLDRKVALKILPAEIAAKQDRMRRFVQEAKSAAALNHPNIAHIYEINQSAGVHFIAMEFIDGVTLREKIHKERTDLKRLLRYLQHAAEGLANAHSAGIVHRDLKPDNIMITQQGHTKILDFGLAKLVEPGAQVSDGLSEVATAVMDQHSIPGTIMGTVGYMSPEQAQGKTREIDQRSDIFSFGCILFEAATGKKPFAGDSVLKSLHMVAYEPAPSLVDLNPSAPADLQRIVRRCLEKDVDDRYQAIKEVAIELKHVRRQMATGPETDTQADATATSYKGETLGSSTTPPTATVSAAPVSSAEYVVQGLKRNKIAVGIVVLAVVLASLAYIYFRNSKTGAAIDSIAVLPFENRSNVADTEYLSDGLTESLIYRLSQLPNLKVSPTSSVMRYKGNGTDLKTVAAELGVRSVMTGRLAQHGDTFTLSVELVDASKNKLIWGEQFERKMSDLLTMQREIAATITQKLQLKLAGNEKGLTKSYTNDNDAYQLYLKGRYYWNKRNEENLRKAIEQFKAAADKDPNFALAFVGLADCYVLLPYYSSATAADVTPQAKAYAQRALQIDDSLGEAHASLGYVQRLLWHWHEAEQELKRATELSPNYATAHKFYGNLLCDMWRFDEGLAEYKRAQELEPLSLIISANLTEVYLATGDLNAAVAQSQRAIDLDPNWYYIRLVLAIAYVEQGKNAEALAEAEKSVELSKRLSGPLGDLGYVYGRTGKRAEAMAVIKELEQMYAQQKANGYDLARAYLGLGDKDQALAWIEKDVETRNATMPGFLSMPPILSLRDDPRFKELTKRIGLEELK